MDESTQSVCCECFELNRGCELAGVCFRIEHGHGARLRTRCVDELELHYLHVLDNDSCRAKHADNFRPDTLYDVLPACRRRELGQCRELCRTSTQTSAGAAPGSVSLTAVYVTSATLSWTAVSGSNGYEIDASSMQFTGGTILSTVTTNNATTSLTVLGLNPDTTYYFNVGSLWSGATTYSGTQPSTSTWTNLLNPSVASVSSSTVVVNWPAFASGSSTDTAQGYELDASTSPNFITYTSSTTTAVAQSTLTISGLIPFTTYYLRVGGVNWDSVVNYIGLSTQTSAGAAPGGVNLSAVYVTSATLSWTTVGGSGGYEVDASSTQFFGGVVLSTVTINNASTSLTVLGLDPDTTYYFNIGALWNGTTTYSGTQPSTSTWTNLLNPSVASVSSSTIAVNWPPFASGSARTPRRATSWTRRRVRISLLTRPRQRQLSRKAR